jgi:pantoate--beta-alanine ligase
MASVIRSTDRLKSALIQQRRTGRKIGFIPTMGFLHEGHLSLIRAASARNEFPVVSIFVNPTQFGPNEDLDSYPKNEECDIKLAIDAGAECIWLPETEHIYPRPGGLAAQQIKIVPGTMAHKLCGSSRPVFFTGICTVVLKLFNLVRPHSAYFGEKDFQQLLIIRTMVQELHLDIDIIGCPIVREKDGLAMSSRNIRIPKDLKSTALHLFATIIKAKELVSRGITQTDVLLAELLKNWPEKLELDYMEFRSPQTLDTVSSCTPDTRLFLGVWLKDGTETRGVRLIDNADMHPL